jgi:hypothetical protein
MLYTGGYWFMDDIGLNEEEGKFDFAEENGVKDCFFIGVGKTGDFLAQRTKNPMTQARYLHSSVSVVEDGREFVYVLGGNHKKENWLNSVEKFDTVEETWKNCAPMTCPRS